MNDITSYSGLNPANLDRSDYMNTLAAEAIVFALGIWTPIKKNAPFICLEPWNGLPADVDETTDAKSKKYSKTIAPDEEYTVGYSMEIIR